MWRIVCIGPGPMNRARRIKDRGPLHPNRQRVIAIADYLRSTGLYESVEVVTSAMKTAALALPGPRVEPNASS